MEKSSFHPALIAFKLVHGADLQQKELHMIEDACCITLFFLRFGFWVKDLTIFDLNIGLYARVKFPGPVGVVSINRPPLLIIPPFLMKSRSEKNRFLKGIIWDSYMLFIMMDPITRFLVVSRGPRRFRELREAGPPIPVPLRQYGNELWPKILGASSLMF